jgi:osmotically-inducible protein OsmY
MHGSGSSSAAVPSGNEDTAIRHAIVQTWSDEHPAVVAVPNVEVTDGMVILTGTLPQAELRVDAVREAWATNGVRQVVDELQVPQAENSTFAHDNSMTIKLRARLTFDPDIQSTNYSIESVGGVIYLMGIAKSDDELAKVKKLASGVGAVKVISYVRVVAPATAPTQKS